MRASTLKIIILVFGFVTTGALVFQYGWLTSMLETVRLQNPGADSIVVEDLQMGFALTSLLLLSIIMLVGGMCYMYKRKFINETQKDFVNNITHEFKTPLAVLKIAGEVLGSDNIEEQPQKIRKYSGIIQQQTDHLQTKVDKLLKMSLTDQRLMRPALADVDLNDIIPQAVAMLEPLIARKGAEVTLEIEPTQTKLKADGQQIQMVVVDLLENALKYSATPIVTVSTFRKKNMLGISCRDNGQGMDKKQQEKVFQRFYRIPTGNIHNVKGFGLGLHFVKKIVNNHKGKIEVHSEEGKGSEFIVYLPM